MSSFSIPGLKLLSIHSFQDHRGEIYKPFTLEGLPDFRVEEVLFVTSGKNVIRGMHFQIFPHEQQKIIFVSQGAIIDVVLDLRPESDTYGKFEKMELSSSEQKALLVPAGCAHGYLVLEESTCVQYIQSGKYSPKFERGVRFDSFGMDWGIKDPILSEKDKTLPDFHEVKPRSEAR